MFQAGNVATDTLQLLKELRDVNECIASLIEVAADGEIEPGEVPEFEAALKELTELAEAIQRLKLLEARVKRKTERKEERAA